MKKRIIKLKREAFDRDHTTEIIRALREEVKNQPYIHFVNDQGENIEGQTITMPGKEEREKLEFKWKTNVPGKATLYPSPKGYGRQITKFVCKENTKTLYMKRDAPVFQDYEAETYEVVKTTEDGTEVSSKIHVTFPEKSEKDLLILSSLKKIEVMELTPLGMDAFALKAKLQQIIKDISNEKEINEVIKNIDTILYYFDFSNKSNNETKNKILAEILEILNRCIQTVYKIELELFAPLYGTKANKDTTVVEKLKKMRGYEEGEIVKIKSFGIKGKTTKKPEVSAIGTTTEKPYIHFINNLGQKITEKSIEIPAKADPVEIELEWATNVPGEATLFAYAENERKTGIKKTFKNKATIRIKKNDPRLKERNKLIVEIKKTTEDRRRIVTSRMQVKYKRASTSQEDSVLRATQGVFETSTDPKLQSYIKEIQNSGIKNLNLTPEQTQTIEQTFINILTQDLKNTNDDNVKELIPKFQPALKLINSSDLQPKAKAEILNNLMRAIENCMVSVYKLKTWPIIDNYGKIPQNGTVIKGKVEARAGYKNKQVVEIINIGLRDRNKLIAPPEVKIISPIDIDDFYKTAKAELTASLEDPYIAELSKNNSLEQKPIGTTTIGKTQEDKIVIHATKISNDKTLVLIAPSQRANDTATVILSMGNALKTNFNLARKDKFTVKEEAYLIIKLNDWEHYLTNIGDPNLFYSLWSYADSKSRKPCIITKAIDEGPLKPYLEVIKKKLDPVVTNEEAITKTLEEFKLLMTEDTSNAILDQKAILNITNPLPFKKANDILQTYITQFNKALTELKNEKDKEAEAPLYGEKFKSKKVNIKGSQSTTSKYDSGTVLGIIQLAIKYQGSENQYIPGCQARITYSR